MFGTALAVAGTGAEPLALVLRWGWVWVLPLAAVRAAARSQRPAAALDADGRQDLHRADRPSRRWRTSGITSSLVRFGIRLRCRTPEPNDFPFHAARVAWVFGFGPTIRLGLSLYSNTPAVLAEVIANAWDADAIEVRIDFDLRENIIAVTDNGAGMDDTDINVRFHERDAAVSSSYIRPAWTVPVGPDRRHSPCAVCEIAESASTMARAVAAVSVAHRPS